MRLRVRRGQRRDRLQGDPGFDHEGRRGQRDRRRAGGLDPGDVRPVGIRRQDDLAAVPLQDRRRCAGPEPEHAVGHLPRLDQADGRNADRLRGRRRGRQQRLDADRVHRGRRDQVDAVRQLLHRVEPDLHVLRPLPAVRAVQLPARPARQGRALPVPERAARLLLGHVVHRQQREPASRERRGAPDRREPAAGREPGRHALARPDPDLRRAVRAREVGLVHAHRAVWPAELHPRPGCRAGVRRPEGILGSSAADRRREGAACRRPDPGAPSRTAPRCGSASRPRTRVPDRGRGAAGVQLAAPHLHQPH